MIRWRPAWTGPLLLLTTGAAMLAWTWRAWPDPLVDFGRELYVPWRLAQGDQLFTDVAWFNGPLSQHWNALLFQAFGEGFSVLVWSNLAVLAASVAMLHGLIRRLTADWVRPSNSPACVVVPVAITARRASSCLSFISYVPQGDQKFSLPNQYAILTYQKAYFELQFIHTRF